MAIASESEALTTGRSFWLGVAAYLVPTFPLGFVWHLMLFAPSYQTLQIYRPDPLIPFGLASMLVQAVIFSWAYPRLFVPAGMAVLRNGMLYGLGIGLLSWSFTTLAVAAKHPMTSLPTYLVLETGFTVVQFLIVGPLIALAYRR
jgi:hypothetical protein